MAQDSSLLLARGLIALTLGMLAFLWPGPTIAALVILFGFYALIDGLTSLTSGRPYSPAAAGPSAMRLRTRQLRPASKEEREC